MKYFPKASLTAAVLFISSFSLSSSLAFAFPNNIPVYTNSFNASTIYVRNGTPLVLDLTSDAIIPEGFPGSVISPTDNATPTYSQWSNFKSSDTTTIQFSGVTMYSVVPGTVAGHVTIHSVQRINALSTGISTVSSGSIMHYICGHDVACPAIKYLIPYKITIQVLNSSAFSPICPLPLPRPNSYSINSCIYRAQ